MGKVCIFPYSFAVGQTSYSQSDWVTHTMDIPVAADGYELLEVPTDTMSSGGVWWIIYNGKSRGNSGGGGALGYFTGSFRQTTTNEPNIPTPWSDYNVMNGKLRKQQQYIFFWTPYDGSVINYDYYNTGSRAAYLYVCGWISDDIFFRNDPDTFDQINWNDAAVAGTEYQEDLSTHQLVTSAPAGINGDWSTFISSSTYNFEYNASDAVGGVSEFPRYSFAQFSRWNGTNPGLYDVTLSQSGVAQSNGIVNGYLNALITRTDPAIVNPVTHNLTSTQVNSSTTSYVTTDLAAHGASAYGGRFVIIRLWISAGISQDRVTAIADTSPTVYRTAVAGRETYMLDDGDDFMCLVDLSNTDTFWIAYEWSSFYSAANVTFHSEIYGYFELSPAVMQPISCTSIVGSTVSNGIHYLGDLREDITLPGNSASYQSIQTYWKVDNIEANMTRGRGGVIFRYLDSNNYYAVVYNSTSNTDYTNGLELIKVIAGVETVLDSYNVALTANNIGFRLIADNANINVYVDSVGTDQEANYILRLTSSDLTMAEGEVGLYFRSL